MNEVNYYESPLLVFCIMWNRIANLNSSPSATFLLSVEL